MKKKFEVTGMTCAACQANVDKVVRKLDGVKDVDVSLLANSMKVEFDDKKVSSQQICEAVKEIGYGAQVNSQNKTTQKSSVQEEWNRRQKKLEDEQKVRKKRLIYSFVLLILLMIIAMGPMMGLPLWQGKEWALVSSLTQLLLTIVILIFQRQFYIKGFKALVHRVPNMDSLVAMGSSSAFIYGLYSMYRMAYGFGFGDEALVHVAMHSLYFESAAMIVTLVSFGKFLEARSKAKTSDALGKLVDLAPKSAWVVKDGEVIQIDSEDVQKDDLLWVRPGQRIPVDGVVESGTGFVDQAAITGESVPVEKLPGDTVMSATMNKNGSFYFRATKVGDDTTLAQIIRLVDEAGSTKAPIARIADKVAGVFVPIVLGIALLTAIVWLAVGKPFEFSLSNAISVMVISCPCALGLATPVAIMVGTGKAAEYGILVKSAESLEQLHSIKTIILDKTGTITSGNPTLQDMVLLDGRLTKDEFLKLAADIEMGSEHPLAQAIVEAAKSKGMNIQMPTYYEAISGRGLKAIVSGKTYYAGNMALMKEMNISINEKVEEHVDYLASQGKTPLLFADGKYVLGILAVADKIRATSKQAISEFKKKGMQVIMLTGDNAITAKAIGKDLELDEVISDVLPAEKEAVVRRYQKDDNKVMMVGDGINDAPALMRSDVGVAIGAGSDIAMDSADVVLMKDSLMDVNTAIDLSTDVIKNVKMNLFWALFYNALGIPIAAGVFYPIWGWLLSPMLGSACMSLSSVCVVTNALRLRFFKPKVEALTEKNEKIEDQVQFKLDDQRYQEEKTMEKKMIVEGMMCPHCKAHVEKALNELDGVESSNAVVETKEVTISLSKDVADSELMKAVKEAGYTPVEMK